MTKLIPVNIELSYLVEWQENGMINGGRYIAEIEHDCKTGAFSTTAGIRVFRTDDGKLYTRNMIDQLWKIRNTPSIHDVIQNHNPIVYGTLPLSSYPGWYFITSDYNDQTHLRLNIILPLILLKGLISDNIIFNERFSTVWGWLFCEGNDARCSFEMIPELETREASIAAGLQRVNDISREINSYMAQSMSQTRLSWEDINLGFVTSKCCFNGINWEGILTICLPTEDGKYLKQNLRSSDILFGQRLTHKWGELSNMCRCVKIPICSSTKQGIRDEHEKYITTIINTFKRNIKFQDRINFILLRSDMNKYYHGTVPPCDIQIGEYHMTTFYEHDKWITELSLRIPIASTRTIGIPYMRHMIHPHIPTVDTPCLLNEKLWACWGSYTPEYRFRTVLFSGETPDESRTAALLFINDEKEQFLALTPWRFDSK
jgi:hypothetical protein